MSSPDNRSSSFSSKTIDTRTKKLATAAILATLALIFSYLESLIPLSFTIPGVKLGIANLVILIALYKLDFKYALAINLVRILVSGLLFSGVFGIIYSFAGGLLSLLVMWLLKSTNLFSIVGVSMAGGVAHNIGQLLVASLIVSDFRMFIYMPILMFSGLISGIVLGYVCYYILNRSLS
ncbi:MAG: Gx transporter family protein [Firmicutes bacterium]|nr:Gx transporter family protein [Bacillota bacterium]